MPPTPPSTLAIGNIVKETSACGPLQGLVRTPVQGTFEGLLTQTKIDQGHTDEIVPYTDKDGIQSQYLEVPLKDGSGYRVFGHQVTQYTTVLGVSGARNFALGGGNAGGAWGQGGLGSSSANQQLVTNIELLLCEVGTVRFPAEPKVVYVERKEVRE